MHSEGYSTWFVCLSVVCVSVTMFSATRHNEATKKLCQQVQRYIGLNLELAIFVKILRSKVMVWKPSKRAIMQISMPYLDLASVRVVHCRGIRSYDGGQKSSPLINICLALSNSQRASEKPCVITQHGPVHVSSAPRVSNSFTPLRNKDMPSLKLS